MWKGREMGEWKKEVLIYHSQKSKSQTLEGKTRNNNIADDCEI